MFNTEIQLPEAVSSLPVKDVSCSKFDIKTKRLDCIFYTSSNYLTQLKLHAKSYDETITTNSNWSYTWLPYQYLIYKEYTPLKRSMHINKETLIFASNKNDIKKNIDIMIYKRNQENAEEKDIKAAVPVGKALFDSIKNVFVDQDGNSSFDPERLEIGENLLMITQNDSNNKFYLNLVRINNDYGIQIDDPYKFNSNKKNMAL